MYCVGCMHSILYIFLLYVCFSSLFLVKWSVFELGWFFVFSVKSLENVRVLIQFWWCIQRRNVMYWCMLDTIHTCMDTWIANSWLMSVSVCLQSVLLCHMSKTGFYWCNSKRKWWIMKHFSFGRIEGRKLTLGGRKAEKLFLYRLLCFCLTRLLKCQTIKSVI